MLYLFKKNLHRDGWATGFYYVQGCKLLASGTRDHILYIRKVGIFKRVKLINALLVFKSVNFDFLSTRVWYETNWIKSVIVNFVEIITDLAGICRNFSLFNNWKGGFYNCKELRRRWSAFTKSSRKRSEANCNMKKESSSLFMSNKLYPMPLFPKSDEESLTFSRCDA